MTRQYEAVYVFDSTLEDAAITDKLGRLHGLLGTPGDLQLNHWGRRQLAYPIQHLAKAHYVLMNIECGAAVLAELQSGFRFNDAVLRHLIVSREGAVTEMSPIMKNKDDKGDRRGRRDDEGFGFGGDDDEPRPRRERAPREEAVAAPAEPAAE